jgi:pimeloyl-ACP methyl ester carboxylesterase
MLRWVIRGVAVLLLLALAGAVGILGWRAVARFQIAHRRAIDPVAGIETMEKVSIGGIDQWIEIRGRHRDNPVLLVLHGGPGSPLMPLAHGFQDRWEEIFTVVQWDQRGAGKTSRTAPASAIRSTITMARLVSDVTEMAHYLSDRFGGRRIFLLAHSWGTALGVAAVQSHPELFEAYVGVGQVVSFDANERASYNGVLELARSRHDSVALHDLNALAPYPKPRSMAGVDVERKWVDRLGGTWHRRIDVRSLIFRAPEYLLRDLTYYFRDPTPTFGGLSNELTQFEAARLGLRFRVPVVLVMGKYDLTTPETVAREYFEQISAPSKEYIQFTRSAHFPFLEEPDRFAEVLRTKVRPLVP